MEPLISVIVPIYGAEKYLHNCVNSIINQTYKNLEIILVDDQSPDRCPELCDEYATKDRRIKVIHQKNKGVSGARNTGLELATGSYIMFVDSDDEIYTNAIEVLLNDMLKYDADIVAGMSTRVFLNKTYISGEENGDIILYQGDEPIILSLKGATHTASACAKLFKSEFIQGLYFEEGKNMHEDGFFIFQCFAKKPVLIYHNVLVYRYNMREGSSSRQPFSDKYLSIVYFLKQKKDIILKEYPQYIEHAYDMEVRTCLQILSVLCKTKGRKYVQLQRQCIKKVCEFYKYHTPINSYHKKLAWIVRYRLYSLYKLLVIIKYKM